MSVNYNPKIITNSMVLCLDANNSKSYPSSGTTWFDISTNNRNGTLTNGASVSNGYVTFDSTDDRVVTSSTTITYSGGTFEIWVYLNANSRNQGFLSHNQGFPYINLWMSSSNLMRWEVFKVDGVGASTNSTTIFSANVWYHVVGTFNTTNTISLYINGKIESQRTDLTDVPTSTTAPIYVGDYDAGTYPASCRIANARIYNRELSGNEIQQNFQALRGRFGI